MTNDALDIQSSNPVTHSAEEKKSGRRAPVRLNFQELTRRQEKALQREMMTDDGSFDRGERNRPDEVNDCLVKIHEWF